MFNLTHQYQSLIIIKRMYKHQTNLKLIKFKLLNNSIMIFNSINRVIFIIHIITFIKKKKKKKIIIIILLLERVIIVLINKFWVKK
jgi:hypothetical protein